MTYSNTLLHRALSSQSPKVVVFETDSFYDRTDVSLALTRTFQDILPILEYHSRWKSLTLADFTTTPTATWTDDNRGFAIRSGVKAADATNYMALVVEAARAKKSIKNDVNRRVNAEIANQARSVSAAADQRYLIERAERVLDVRSLPPVIRSFMVRSAMA